MTPLKKKRKKEKTHQTQAHKTTLSNCRESEKANGKTTASSQLPTGPLGVQGPSEEPTDTLWHLNERQQELCPLTYTQERSLWKFPARLSSQCLGGRREKELCPDSMGCGKGRSSTSPFLLVYLCGSVKLLHLYPDTLHWLELGHYDRFLYSVVSLFIKPVLNFDDTFYAINFLQFHLTTMTAISNL